MRAPSVLPASAIALLMIVPSCSGGGDPSTSSPATVTTLAQLVGRWGGEYVGHDQSVREAWLMIDPAEYGSTIATAAMVFGDPEPWMTTLPGFVCTPLSCATVGQVRLLPGSLIFVAQSIECVWSTASTGVLATIPESQGSAGQLVVNLHR